MWFHVLDGDPTEWERKTLLANGFRLDDDKRRYKVKVGKAEEGVMMYVAKTIRKGGTQ